MECIHIYGMFLRNFKKIQWIENLTNLNVCRPFIEFGYTFTLHHYFAKNQLYYNYVSGFINMYCSDNKVEQITDTHAQTHIPARVPKGEIWKVLESEDGIRSTTSCQVWALCNICIHLLFTLLIMIAMTLFILFIILVTTRWICKYLGCERDMVLCASDDDVLHILSLLLLLYIFEIIL